MTATLTVAETYIFSTTLYIITILALIGGIHLIYNICSCKKKCKNKCCKCFNHRNLSKLVLTRSHSSIATPSVQKKLSINGYSIKNSKNTKKREIHNEDDYDMESESFTSKLCKIVCVSTVIFFLIFLFVGCYQQSMHNNYINGFGLFTFHSMGQCRVLFCMVGFYVYGKMFLYAYFVLRAYNMLEGSQLNYNRTTVVCILCIYFIMMNFILFSMIYIHLTDDYCVQYTNQHNSKHIHQKRSIMFGIDAAVDGSMAILSVSLLIHKLFSLVRESMHIHGGLSHITGTTPHVSPMPSPRQSILSQSQSKHMINRLRSLSDTTTMSHLNRSNPQKKANNNVNIAAKALEKKRKHTRLSKQIEMARNLKKVQNMNNFRSCSRSTNDSDESTGQGTHSQLQSAPSSTRQSRLQSRRVSASITPSIVLGDHDPDPFATPELELGTICSTKQLIDDDINKVKKLSIGCLLQQDEILELQRQNDADDDDDDNDNDLCIDDENMRFDMIEEDEDKMVTLTLPDINMNINAFESNENESEPSEEGDEEKSPLQANNSNKLQIPYVLSNTLSSNNSNSRSQRSQSLKIMNSASPHSKSKSKSKSKSPRGGGVLSLSRRSSSIFSKASAIASGISKEHIKRFHSVTQYDNEILLLSTKLLILLTVCVVSSFCSFLLLFTIIKTNENTGIFLVYGIDSFINIWLLAFTFKFSNKCYNVLFNCGNSNRCTKLCFPMVKTAALTWKFCCCAKRSKLNFPAYDGDKVRKAKIKKHKNGHHPVSQNSVTYNYSNNGIMHRIEENKGRNSLDIALEDDGDNNDESQCHMNCCFCCWGNEQEIQIFHMAVGEVELMLRQNRKLYK